MNTDKKRKNIFTFNCFFNLINKISENPCNLWLKIKYSYFTYLE
jgi:hypothetical protein